ncbi:MAG: biopolymer transporter ExbD [Deltaproteobacteria bacterium]|nr:biopolymer transporter ExbD [Deltaproteobacteria bacterium]
MGGAAPVEGGKGKKKSLDAVINLVPFIDLLSSLIAFLLMTAVWTQIATLQVGQQGNSQAPQQQPQEEKVKLTITVTERGFMMQAGADQVTIEKAGNDYNFEDLNKKLADLKANLPELEDVTVQAEDGVAYDVLVRVIDSCLGNRLTNVMLTSPTST